MPKQNPGIAALAGALSGFGGQLQKRQDLKTKEQENQMSILPALINKGMIKPGGGINAGGLNLGLQNPPQDASNLLDLQRIKESQFDMSGKGILAKQLAKAMGTASMMSGGFNPDDVLTAFQNPQLLTALNAILQGEATAGKPITEEIALEYMKKAKGDKDLARQLAIQDGYSL